MSASSATTGVVRLIISDRVKFNLAIHMLKYCLNIEEQGILFVALKIKPTTPLRLMFFISLNVLKQALYVPKTKKPKLAFRLFICTPN